VLSLTGLILAGCEADSIRSSSPDAVGGPPSGAASREVTVFATGFTFPRGLSFGPDGYLYVAEAGQAGTGGTTPAQCAQLPAPLGPYRSGPTARISRVSPTGQVSTVAQGLPSGANGLGDVLGVADVAFIGRTLYALVAGGGCSHGSADVPASLVRVSHGGGWDVVTNLSAYQAGHPVAVAPPDFDPDGSWYSMTEYGGKLVAVDLTTGVETRQGDSLHLYKRPRVSADGTRLVVEAYPITVSSSATDTAFSRWADLWLLEE